MAFGKLRTISDEDLLLIAETKLRESMFLGNNPQIQLTAATVSQAASNLLLVRALVK